MRRLARCALAALAATCFAAPVYAAPPVVQAPVATLAPVYAAPRIVAILAEPAQAALHAQVAPIAPAAVAVERRPTVADAKAYALDVLGPTEYRCLNSIIAGESRWDPTVWNTKGSGAYGLGQARPASKMAPFGADYMTNPVTQVKFVIDYTATKYGSACNAAAFRFANGWY